MHSGLTTLTGTTTSEPKSIWDLDIGISLDKAKPTSLLFLALFPQFYHNMP